ncbi:MAG: hypothetical protein H6538_08495 [Bacteroidales bacterium]|nr:hypothetical protein [Bacteroidales bacterium]MCB8999168.1 hypothetical protein [Bacteroidales bacterium]
MKPTTYFPLYPSVFKYIGGLISLAGVILLVISNREFELLVYLGLLLIAFSREKSEDQPIINARNDVFKTVLGIYLSVMLALNLVEILSPSFVFIPEPLVYIGFPLMLYLIVFYLSLLFKVNLDSSVSIGENIQNHRGLYLIWLLVVVIVAVVLIAVVFF